MSNLRLLAQKTWEVKDLPFDRDNYVSSYSLLLPIDYCKKVAEFKFMAQYTPAVSRDLYGKELVDGKGYCLQSRIVFSKEFAISHDEALDKTNIFCRTTNLTNSQVEDVKTRVYFNKEVFPLSQMFIRLKDHILMQFYVHDYSQEVDMDPFTSYLFKVTPTGFQQLEEFRGMKYASMGKDGFVSGIKTWQSVITALDLNFIDDGSMGRTAAEFNKTLIKKEKLK